MIGFAAIGTSASASATDDDSCHRIGGGDVSNLQLKPQEANLNPPGISVLLGGTAQQAAADWRTVFAKPGASAKASTVGTADIGDIRKLGFDVILAPTPSFPNHGRLIHPTEGAAGFTAENLRELSQLFTDTTGL
jgi:hypothetical protein